MLNPNLFWAADWQDLYDYFTRGYPPLVLQLLVINTIFLIIFIIRRARHPQPERHTTSYIVQSLLIAANMLVTFQDNILSATSRQF